MAPPAPLGPGWRVTGGGVMARHWQDACVDAVAKLPPLRARRFSETIRVELRAFLQSAMRRRVDSRPRTTGAATDRDPEPDELGRCQCRRVIAPRALLEGVGRG